MFTADNAEGARKLRVQYLLHCTIYLCSTGDTGGGCFQHFNVMLDLDIYVSALSISADVT